MKDVLLLTSHPLAPPWDSADKQLAESVARHVEGYRFSAFGRAGEPFRPAARRIPVWSPDGRPGRLTRLQVAGLALAFELAVDLVHAVLTIGPGFARFAALHRKLPRPLRRPAIHTVPGVVQPGYLPRGSALGDVTVALSEPTAAALRAAGVPDVRVVSPGIPLTRWPPAARPASGGPSLLFAGHHDTGGGAEEAILGAAAAARLGCPARLVLAMRARLGQDPGREADRLRAAGRAEGLEGIEVLGHVEDMSALVRAASVVVLPATSLGGKADVPLIVLEAMATRRPVVVADIPPLGPLGDGAVRVPARDPDALGRAIASLLRDGPRWEAQALAGRKLVEERFSDLAMAARYGELYDEVLATRGRGR